MKKSQRPGKNANVCKKVVCSHRPDAVNAPGEAPPNPGRWEAAELHDSARLIFPSVCGTSFVLSYSCLPLSSALLVCAKKSRVNSDFFFVLVLIPAFSNNY